MSKLYLRLAVGIAAVAVAMLAWAPADAACGFSRSFGNYPSSGACNYYCYVVSPGESSSASIVADYWALGSGNPTDGSGNDSGNYEWDGSGGTQAWGVKFAGGWSWSTDTENGTTDGCPSGSDMIVSITDQSADGQTGYYLVTAADENTANKKDYDFGQNGGSLTLQAIPTPTITSSSRAGNDITVNLSWTNNLAAAYVDNNTGNAASAVVTGWSVLKQEVARGSAAPASRGAGGWTSVHTESGSGAITATLTFACDTPASNEVFLALAPALDSGIVPGHVGANSTRIECDPNMADPDPKFKIIKKKGPGRVDRN